MARPECRRNRAKDPHVAWRIASEQSPELNLVHYTATGSLNLCNRRKGGSSLGCERNSHSSAPQHIKAKQSSEERTCAFQDTGVEKTYNVSPKRLTDGRFNSPSTHIVCA
jgi:hypothetical protein